MAKVIKEEVHELTEEERVVHAKYNGVEVVRYGDRWFLEPVPAIPRGSGGFSANRATSPSPLKERKELTLKEAAETAAEEIKNDWTPEKRAWPSGFQVYWGQMGGEEFDEIVKSICPMLHMEIEYADLGDGHEFMALKCPGCDDWLRIYDGQLEGKTCTDHDRYGSGGCGFHGYTIGPHAGYICDLGDKINKERQEEARKKREEAAKKDKKKVPA